MPSSIFVSTIDESEVIAAVPEPLSSVRGDAVGKLRMLSCDIYQDPKRRADDGANIWVEAVVDAASYHSDSAMRDSAVKTSILDTKDFPTISFKGGSSWTDVKQTSETSGSVTLKGQLMMHGAVRPFEVPVKVSLSGDKLIGTGEVSFNYTDFGIDPAVDPRTEGRQHGKDQFPHRGDESTARALGASASGSSLVAVSHTP